MSLTKAAREKIAARMLRASKASARDYQSLSNKVLTGERATVGHLATLAAIQEANAKTIKRRYFGGDK